MNLTDIAIINRDFSLMAFYAKDNEYCVDKAIFELTDDKIANYCTYVRDNINSYRASNTNVNTVVNRLSAQYDEFKADIDDLRIPAEEFNEYLRKSTEGPNIRKYRAVKTKLKYAMIPFAHLDDRPVSEDNYNNLDARNTQNTTGQKNIILNRNNPFSDITIQNQEFIYPDTSGKFQTLQFNVGYTMAKIDNETTASVILQPDFKITKSNERDQIANTITMDNSITTQMPDTQGDLELLYI